MAIRKPPRRNLPADAEKWGRYTDDTLRQAQVDIEALRRDLTSGLRSVTSSMNRIAKQQETLISQQAQLTQVVNDIPVSHSDSNNRKGYAIPQGTNTVMLTINIPWVSGKSKCELFVYGEAFFYAGGLPQSDIAAWRAAVNSNLGSIAPAVPFNMDFKYSTFAHSARVTSQQTIAVTARATAPSAHSSESINDLNLYAFATFM